MLRATAKWPMWRQPPVVIALVLAVDLSAVLIPALFWHAVTRSNIELAVALGTLSIAYSTFTCSAERVRRTLHQGAEAVQVLEPAGDLGLRGRRHCCRSI